jgi:hypothetical protein
MLEIYVEVGQKQVVACSWKWPGWCRYGKIADQAVQVLLDSAPRYKIIVQRAGIPFEQISQYTITHIEGNANTDWAPSIITDRDTQPWEADEAQRGVDILLSAWSIIDDIIRTSSRELSKGSRGGGRELDEIFNHVVESERAYARKIGIKHPLFPVTDQSLLKNFRDEIIVKLSAPSDGSLLTPGGWPASYAVRRIAWHVIDHIWEIEDRQIRTS